MNYKFLITLLIILSIFAVIDTYLWMSYQKTINERSFRYFKWFIPITSILFFVGIFLFIFRSSFESINNTKLVNYTMGMALGMIVVKLFAILPILLEDIVRLSLYLKDSIFLKQSATSLHSRRNFVRNISLGAAALPLIGTIYAITKGKYQYHNKKINLFLSRLPKSFDGLKIVQFSDFHAGSFDDFEKVKKGLDLINEENPDIIVFTGDLINNRIGEATKYFELFKNLDAKYGKFAILGNHDYGDYVPFNSKEERQEHLEEIYDFFEAAGFHLLNNSHIEISNDSDSFNLIGVENWGSGRFPKYGDIDVAMNGMDEQKFNILLSHDPDHWEYIVRELPQTIDLTLSGHTHGFQAGVNISGWRWSPVKYRYKRWLGLYSEENKYLFVSKGFGFLGFPGRIGMTPEIVTFKLFKE